ncbi:Putative protein-S-isoprenylcysteine methyltransferase [Halapricum desulfuricans]|uniref:Isoprenylcysteine carboxylmethyltransferase family protein n=1 Tax=Halapricum desulfuricans TaxID=2841257 RepID=A0A897NFP4_9EURY|nr:methyltransferase [Halapricum desulfuricans]QSG11532.1 Putative protein-S-isoprenylcysteine methyltransferase [Halapricum desulfuricans]
MAGTFVIGSLALALLAETAEIAALAVSVRWPDRRMWPPGEIDRRWLFYWGNTAVVVGALSVVAFHDAESWVFAGLVWDVLGGGLVVVGGALAVWAGRTLRLRESVGLGGLLVTDGPYRYSRNPQLIGIGLVAIGVLVAVNSTLLTVGAIPGVIWLWLLPVAEEPWLAEQFGEEYRAYQRIVPRFVGWRTIDRLLDR